MNYVVKNTILMYNIHGIRGNIHAICKDRRLENRHAFG